jgi:hypothetical protein
MRKITGLSVRMSEFLLAKWAIVTRQHVQAKMNFLTALVFDPALILASAARTCESPMAEARRAE